MPPRGSSGDNHADTFPIDHSTQSRYLQPGVLLPLGLQVLQVPVPDSAFINHLQHYIPSWQSTIPQATMSPQASSAPPPPSSSSSFLAGRLLSQSEWPALSSWPTLGTSTANTITPNKAATSGDSSNYPSSRPSEIISSTATSTTTTPSSTSTSAAPARAIQPPPPPPLDRFASVYVPQVLRQISDAQPSRIVRPPYVPSQDPMEYSSAIFPKTLLDTIASEKALAERRIMLDPKFNLTSSRLEKISNGDDPDLDYTIKLLKMQMVEFLQRRSDLAASTLYDADISAAVQEDVASGLFKIEAPEIREGYPMLEINDAVFLRHVRGRSHKISWDGVMYIASVEAIQRSLGLVIVKCPALVKFVQTRTKSFIVSFEPQGRPFYMVRDALFSLNHSLQHQKSNEPQRSNQSMLLHDWLFPVEDPIDKAEERSKKEPSDKEISWTDVTLNAEQKHAVRSFTQRRRRFPYLISGPPGTGKTKTVIETVLQILASRPSTSILLCGASNPSTDTLAFRLSEHLDPKTMFRLNDESRPFDEVSARLLPYCKVVGNRFGIPDFSALRSYRVIVTSALDSSVLARYNFTNDTLARLEHTLLSNWMPDMYHPEHFHFDYFILDEAAQLCEQDIAPALNVMLPRSPTMEAAEHARRQAPQICLVGDHHQLGPFVSSFEARTAEMDLSLFQRLLERPMYRDHPNARHQIAKRRLLNPSSDAQKADQDGLQDSTRLDLDAPLCNLVRNYRSHPGLLMVPSTLFYNDTLHPSAAAEIQETPLLRWPGLKGSRIPLLLRHTEGREDAVLEGSSWFNAVEIQNLVATVRDLADLSGLPGRRYVVKPSEISVISPFREQVWKIRIALRKLGLGEVNVGRESDLQGAENRVIIISTVRTSDRFLKDDRRRNRGLIFEPKRFNVATTRAKELLIIFGHVKTLYGDPFWKTLINFAVRQGCYQGPDLEELGLELDPASGLSRLEEESLMMMMMTSSRDDEEEEEEEEEEDGGKAMPVIMDEGSKGLTLAGSVVRIALASEGY